MKDNEAFEYISNETLENISDKKEIKEEKIIESNQFIEGLPEWNLEPPYELVRRKQL